MLHDNHFYEKCWHFHWWNVIHTCYISHGMRSKLSNKKRGKLIVRRRYCTCTCRDKFRANVKLVVLLTRNSWISFLLLFTLHFSSSLPSSNSNYNLKLSRTKKWRIRCMSSQEKRANNVQKIWKSTFRKLFALSSWQLVYIITSLSLSSNFAASYTIFKKIRKTKSFYLSTRSKINCR